MSDFSPAFAEDKCFYHAGGPQNKRIRSGAGRRPHSEPRDHQLIDVITLGTWNSEDLASLKPNRARAERLAPHLRMYLSCYLVDFTRKELVPIPAMKHQ
jgi:hypothetical protein